MNCPKCNSSNFSKFDSDLRRHHYMCKDCTTKWHKTHNLGQVVGAVGLIMMVGAAATGLDQYVNKS